MKKNKEEFNESCEKRKTLLFEFINYKKSEIYIYNRNMYMQDKKELKKCNYKYLSKELTFNFLKFPLNCSCNKVIMNFIKSVAIYQIFILQFAVTIADGSSDTESHEDTLSAFKKVVEQKAKDFWEFIKKSLCEICNQIGLQSTGICGKHYVTIPVTFSLFILVFIIICLICCKCCCKKSCCKKKENDESDVDCNQFIMGPDGQMYSQMYQGQMMQPQMIPAGMMYPQMYPGQMYYPQMLQQGMQQPEMLQQGILQQGMLQQGMQQPEMLQQGILQQGMLQQGMQQPEMQYMDMQQSETQLL
ncbi:hypothetical protein, conserved [Plasmodium vivax]|nr:hypothetical protein, conserved [Plasmodium vivax]